jgi:predicted DCC family thiol-disulfide oxidoreductase YuxK
VLIYDGDCAFCTSTARWLDRRGQGRIEIQPWQSTDLEALGLSVDEVTSAAYWVDPTNRTHRGHRAVGRSLEAIGGAYRPIGWLIGHRPLAWLTDPGYRLIARYRHRLPGATEACRLDSDRLR